LRHRSREEKSRGGGDSRNAKPQIRTRSRGKLIACSVRLELPFIRSVPGPSTREVARRVIGCFQPFPHVATLVKRAMGTGVIVNASIRGLTGIVAIVRHRL